MVGEGNEDRGEKGRDGRGGKGRGIDSKGREQEIGFMK